MSGELVPVASYEKFNIGVVVPPEFPRTKLLTVVEEDKLIVVEVSIRTSSSAVGTVSVLQFKASSQFAVLAPPSQYILAAQVLV